MKKLVIIFFLVHCTLFAGNEANVWYFGYNAGVDFNSGTPVALTDGALSTFEGVASICDSLGNILFYTDGITVWNKNHTVMTNGNGLKGNFSATQSGVIVPSPGNETIYYIFTVTHIGEADGFNYSVVDMALSGGLGAITTKNQQLHTPVSEKVTAVQHSNNNDIWVITHEWGSNRYFAFLVTPSGVNPTPVISSAGLIHTGDVWNAIGYMKVSPDRKKIANVMYRMTSFELLDFDNTTGIVSNPITLTDNDYSGLYGIEFSTDGKLLYVGRHLKKAKIFQFDISSDDPVLIQDSRYNVFESANVEFGALQLGPDEKIYISDNNYPSLSVINNPNSKGADCNFSFNGVSLNGKQAGLGLPTFIQSFFDYTLELSSNSPVCKGESILLNCETIEDAVYSWAGPAGFTSNEINPVISPAAKENEGVYTVTINERTGRVLTGSIDVYIIDTQAEFDPPNLIDIGTVCLSKSSDIGFSFTNTSEFPFVIKSASLLNSGLSYNVNTSVAVGTELQPGSNLNFTLDFSPIAPGTFLDSLIIEIESPCYWRFAVGLTGNGEKSETTITVADTTAEIGEYICIPVYASAFCDYEDVFSFDYEAEIQLQGYVFYVTEIREANLISNKILNGVQTVRFSGVVDTLGREPRLIAYLCGIALLGENDSSSIKLSEFKLSDDNIEYRTIDGSIKTGDVCANNLTRFRNFKPFDIELLQNPIKETAMIKLMLPIEGTYLLETYNYIGGKVISEEITAPSNSIEITKSIDFSKMSAGPYIVMLKSPYGISAIKVLKL